MVDNRGWVHCPICYRKTRTKIRPDTEAKNLIVFCPKCKVEHVMDIKNMDSKESKVSKIVPVTEFQCQ